MRINPKEARRHPYTGEVWTPSRVFTSPTYERVLSVLFLIGALLLAIPFVLPP